ncbi:MAG: DUF445 family protein [Spirochaetaceae bacterium]|nr:MAG: DUF445 family protein [Spirochaetaceae bacterium]
MQNGAAALARFLPYALPPLIGAAIGYVTNYIAIRMLFRPLVEKRLLGVRVPFTPGIIPRRRAELAESIGRMVSTQLLTEDAVRTHTKTPRFRSAIHESIERLTSDLLTAVPSEHSRDAVHRVVRGAEQVINSVVEKLLHSDLFINGVGDIAHRSVLGLTDVPLDRLLPQGGASAAVLISRLYDSLTEGRLRDNLLTVVDQWVSRQLQANTPMSDFISDETVSRIREVMTGIYDPSFEHLIVWLRKPDVRHELARHGRVILRDILDKLSVVQRFLVSAAQYDRQLEERMPQIIDDLIRTLETAGSDPANRNRIIAAVIDAVEKIRSQGIADAAWRGDMDVQLRTRQLIEEVFTVMARSSVRERVLAAFDAATGGLSQMTLGELAEDYLSVSRMALADAARRTVRRHLSAPSSIETVWHAVRRIMSRFFRRLESEPVGDVIELTAERRQQLDLLLADGVYRIVDRRLPQIVQTLDVRSLVVDKVNSLDVSQVEQLLLMVIARHLKYINLFGALLGALIGGSQIFVARLF